MIRINKPTAPEVLRTRGVAAAQALCAAHDASPEAYRKGTKRFDADFNRAIYAAPAVKDALLAAQHGKCAFCESQVRHVSFGDVEHFRPKGGYRQAAKDRLRRPGYFWLVYTWENLFFSCQMCNQMYKGNLFPLKNPRRRARPRARNITAEEPLLIDPTAYDPDGYIRFEFGLAAAVDDCPEGVTTIAAFGLNRPDLFEARTRHLQTLRKLVAIRADLQKELARRSSRVLASQIAGIEECLRAHVKANQVYSAVARAYLNRVGLSFGVPS